VVYFKNDDLYSLPKVSDIGGLVAQISLPNKPREISSEVYPTEGPMWGHPMPVLGAILWAFIAKT
jgi:hypothetical protein